MRLQTLVDAALGTGQDFNDLCHNLAAKGVEVEVGGDIRTIRRHFNDAQIDKSCRLARG